MSVDDDALGDLLDELGIELEPNAVAPQIEPVLEALVQQAPATAEQAAGAAAEAVWDEELEMELTAAFEQLREQSLEDDGELVPAIDAATAELDCAAGQNRVALALVWRAALKLLRRANRNYERMAELEHALAAAPATAHRRLTLPVAAAASLAAGVGDEEAANAIARFVGAAPPTPRTTRKKLDRATADLARTLATKERRRDVRAALAEVAVLSADEFPAAAAALERLLAEPTPKDPAKDEVWRTLVVGLAQERVADALGYEEDRFFD